ncbi:MAG TPA: ABC transporter permease [Blastocatellia bacterium]|nr:ABC transporter permease [Blastocatellia bacterium]
MQTLWQDLRYGVRMLLKARNFTLIAVLTLALGIGANAAIFSVVNAVLLQPLPYGDPDRLVWMWGAIRNGGRSASVSPPDFIDYRAQNSVFDQFGASFSSSSSINLTGAGEPERLNSRVVTANYFDVLGAKPLHGRVFKSEEEQFGRHRVVVLSHGLWRRRFGADQTIVGREITLNDEDYTVIGVMPPDFRPPHAAELWGPMPLDNPGMNARHSHFLRPIGKLKAGVTLAQAQSEMDAIARRLEEQYPESNTGWSLRLVPLHEQMTGTSKTALLVLLGAVAFVLLIACANVANLLLIRAVSRRKEIAVRAALGASRWRIARQMLTESLLIALAGGMLGALLTVWGIDLLVAFSAGNLPPTARISIDATVLAFTVGISVLTGVLFGLAPALHTLKVNLNDSLNAEGRSGSASFERNRTHNLLVVMETAIAVVLLVGAGLLIRSLVRLQNVNPGFDAENALTLRIDLSERKYDRSEKTASFFSQLENRLAALPGVEAVGMTTELPLSGQRNDAPFIVAGRPPVRPNERYGADFRRVNRQIFQAMRIPLLRGRQFTEQEVSAGAPVLIVSESLARAVFPNEDPLGQRLMFGPNDQPREIIGIVGDVSHRGLELRPFPTMYLPMRGTGWKNLVIRTTTDPLSLASAVRQEIKALDPDLALAGMKPLEQVVYESVAEPRYRTTLLGLFAAVALLLAAIGLYGVLAYAVTLRTREIGIRMALGAQPRDALRLIIRQGIKLVLIGVLLGLGAALALTRLMRTLLFEVNAADPLTFGVIALALTLVALVACWIPARRATKVDPMIALRCD